MRKIKSLGILFLLLMSIFVNAQGQKLDNSPEALAKSFTGWLLKTVEIDSLTAKKTYNCFLVYNTESDAIMKKIEEKKSKGTFIKGDYKESWKQLELKRDSCLIQVLTKNQFDKWKEEEKKYSYKHEGK
jgi:hypothetical protein